MRHLLTLMDYSSEEIIEILDLAQRLKHDVQQGDRQPLLKGKVLALLFEKPSLRTRVSFEAGMAQLGGATLFFGEEVGFGKREPIADFARVLCQYVDAIVCRTFAHEKLTELAKHSSCSVINGLSDLVHPCQALADLLTLRERFGGFAGRKIAFIGDANNVARSLAIVCAKLHVKFSIACPAEYQFDADFQRQIRDLGGSMEQTDDPRQAVQHADVVYTDVWTSMGQEEESQARRRAFAAMQVDADLMCEAPPHAIFLHCLPAHRGEEVTAEVIDGAQGAVIQQAANRMHAQKGLLVWLLT